MYKKATILVAAFALFAFTVPAAMASSSKCKVTGIQDSVVTLDCGKKAAKLKIGDKVKVKVDKKKAIEGC